ncbi:SapC family protein [Microbulbifer litoralis]|uniref:SapC family protein n=1 Tax=Microbulbifer litoralis TaxID=2933965 RepID=UPI0020291A4D
MEPSSGRRLVPLDRNRHRSYRIARGSYGHAAQQQTCPVLLGEFAEVSAECPILFVRSEEGGALCCVAMLGVTPGHNLFWQNSRWRGRYVPCHLRARPFAMARIGESGKQMAVCVDESSPLLLAGGESGEPLFEPGGGRTEYLDNMAHLLVQLQRQGTLTDTFVRYLQAERLLEEQVIQVRLQGGVNHRLNGVFRVDETALQALPEERFIELRRRGYLSPIYAHLHSLRRVDNLSRLHARQRRENLH